MDNIIHVFDELVQKTFFRVKEIGKSSEISKISRSELKLYGSVIKILSIKAVEFSVILVGLLIIGRSDIEYIVFKNKVESLQSLLRGY